MDAYTFRRTSTYTGPHEAIRELAFTMLVGVVHYSDGVTQSIKLSKVRPVTHTPKPKPANWSQFRLAGAISALAALATTRLPDPRDDADLREALALLVGIVRRMKDNRKETK